VPDNDEGYSPLSDDEVERLIESDLDYWIGYREQSGLNADRDYVIDLARDKSTRDIFELMGMPLSRSEFQKSSKRLVRESRRESSRNNLLR
jgi:hypothetical protein